MARQRVRDQTDAATGTDAVGQSDLESFTGGGSA